MKTFGVTALCLLALAGWMGSAAAKEVRLGYVDSDRILESFEDYRTARQTLQEEERTYITKAQGMEEVSDEAKQERVNRLREKQTELENYRKEIWGEGGKLYNRNLELSRPVLDKINLAIEKVSKEENYDFVFDAASANIVYALPEHDLTEKILEELKKE